MASAATTSSAQSTAGGPSRAATVPFFDMRAFDADSPFFVLRSTFASTVIGAAIGAGAGFTSHLNPYEAGLIMGKRWFLLSLSFFSAREYLVSPILLSTRITSRHAQRLEEMSEKAKGKQPDVGPTSLSDIQNDRMLDSTLTAVLGYGTYAGFTRGRGAVVRAGLTAGLGVAIVQYAFNFARVTRIKLLAAKEESPKEEQAPAAQSMQIRQSLENPAQKLDVKYEDTLQGRVLSIMRRVLPLEEMTREQYVQKLHEERDAIDRKLAALEQEENRLYAEVQRQLEAKGQTIHTTSA